MSIRVIKNEFYMDSTISLALFRNVENAKEVRQNVMNGTFEAALLKPSMICDPFQVIVAANRAIHLNRQNKMITKNVHSEILFCLSPTKNISDSFRKFGLADNETSVMVVVADDIDGSTMSAICKCVKGELSDAQDVIHLTETKLIQKIYKIPDEELVVSKLLDSIVSRISSKDVLTL
ncbi:EKC/KEOPS complex subunit TPRKB-like [Mytilus galloprovincialis]|uniref:EKC/KEOPS complex subunit CGI121/TPRKB n=2 Tax=Mytilus TaxID=6548 RepID=A0A8B6BSK9_MYTGA|nr:EKC/KEOPS complex subunit CGI121/TPRKB [Mytilus galloprovincialis]